LVAIRDSADECRAAFAVESVRSRALPGHRLLSIVRLGVGAGGLDEECLDAGLNALAARVAQDHSVLRVTVDVFSLDEKNRRRTAGTLLRHGFAQVAASRSYERTLVLDLRPTEEELFAGIHKNARQGVRNIARFPVRLSTASSFDISPRLQRLSDETRSRTGGSDRPIDWPAFIEMSNRAPGLSRIVTLERTDREGPDSVVSFAWGVLHGEVAEYSESGSIRVDDMKVSTSYALLWDLIVWAKRNGAKWFDFGGVTSGKTGSNDPLGGISDFKRRFSQHEVEAGEQWELSPHPKRAALAAAITRGIGLVRTGLRRTVR
jgi:hypothetical protein